MTASEVRDPSPSRRRLTLLALATAALACGALVAVAPVRAQSKTIRIVVPYTPGGSSDIIARSIAQPLAEALKLTVIVENKPGANGNLGTDIVARSAGALATMSVPVLPFAPGRLSTITLWPSACATRRR